MFSSACFLGRYFILGSGSDGPLISVVLVRDGKPLFEVFRNEPQENLITIVEKTPPGIVTVSEKDKGRFLYKIRPGSDTSVVFGTIRQGELNARISDKEIRIGEVTFQNNLFNGVAVGVTVDENGSFGFGGGSIPPALIDLFQKRQP